MTKNRKLIRLANLKSMLVNGKIKIHPVEKVQTLKLIQAGSNYVRTKAQPKNAHASSERRAETRKAIKNAFAAWLSIPEARRVGLNRRGVGSGRAQ